MNPTPTRFDRVGIVRRMATPNSDAPRHTGLLLAGLLAIPFASVTVAAQLGDIASTTDPRDALAGGLALLAGVALGLAARRFVATVDARIRGAVRLVAAALRRCVRCPVRSLRSSVSPAGRSTRRPCLVSSSSPPKLVDEDLRFTCADPLRPRSHPAVSRTNRIKEIPLMRTNALRLLAALVTLSVVTAACSDDEASEATPPDDMADMEAVDEEHDHDDHDDHEGHDHDHGDDHAGGDHEPHDHDHGSPVDFEGADIPTLGVSVEPDPAGGINITVDTTNFVVAPEAGPLPILS